jgi:hypothetical protein
MSQTTLQLMALLLMALPVLSTTDCDAQPVWDQAGLTLQDCPLVTGWIGEGAEFLQGHGRVEDGGSDPA